MLSDKLITAIIHNDITVIKNSIKSYENIGINIFDTNILNNIFSKALDFESSEVVDYILDNKYITMLMEEDFETISLLYNKDITVKIINSGLLNSISTTYINRALYRDLVGFLALILQENVIKSDFFNQSVLANLVENSSFKIIKFLLDNNYISYNQGDDEILVSSCYLNNTEIFSLVAPFYLVEFPSDAFQGLLEDSDINILISAFNLLPLSEDNKLQLFHNAIESNQSLSLELLPYIGTSSFNDNTLSLITEHSNIYLIELILGQNSNLPSYFFSDSLLVAIYDENIELINNILSHPYLNLCQLKEYTLKEAINQFPVAFHLIFPIYAEYNKDYYDYIENIHELLETAAREDNLPIFTELLIKKKEHESNVLSDNIDYDFLTEFLFNSRESENVFKYLILEPEADHAKLYDFLFNNIHRISFNNIKSLLDRGVVVDKSILTNFISLSLHNKRDVSLPVFKLLISYIHKDCIINYLELFSLLSKSQYKQETLFLLTEKLLIVNNNNINELLSSTALFSLYDSFKYILSLPIAKAFILDDVFILASKSLDPRLVSLIIDDSRIISDNTYEEAAILSGKAICNTRTKPCDSTLSVILNSPRLNHQNVIKEIISNFLTQKNYQYIEMTYNSSSFSKNIIMPLFIDFITKKEDQKNYNAYINSNDSIVFNFIINCDGFNIAYDNYSILYALISYDNLEFFIKAIKGKSIPIEVVNTLLSDFGHIKTIQYNHKQYKSESAISILLNYKDNTLEEQDYNIASKLSLLQNTHCVTDFILKYHNKYPYIFQDIIENLFTARYDDLTLCHIIQETINYVTPNYYFSKIFELNNKHSYDSRIYFPESLLTIIDIINNNDKCSTLEGNIDIVHQKVKIFGRIMRFDNLTNLHYSIAYKLIQCKKTLNILVSSESKELHKYKINKIKNNANFF